MQDNIDDYSHTSSRHLAATESDGESSFRFVSLAYDKDLPSPRMTTPVFDGYNSLFTAQDLIHDLDADRHHQKLAAIGDQFRTLFVGDERDHPPSSSEEEGDESPAALEGGAHTGSFCVWSPNRPAGSEASTGWCRKSRSTGSTTNWLRLRDLIMRRSSSDGKVKLLNSMVKDNRVQEKAVAKKKNRPTTKVSPQEVFYVRNKALREEERRKTYLPYRKDLIGIFH